MEIKGILRVKKEVETVSEKFKKRDIVIETIEEYPQVIVMQLSNGKTDLTNTIEVGKAVCVNFNLRGKMHEKDGKQNYFNTLEAWKINVL